jgi:hypothetical protein
VTLTNEGADQIVEGLAIDNAGNRTFTSVVVSIDKTPPTLAGFPADNDVICRLDPPFLPQYADELSGVDTSSLVVEIDSGDMSGDFERFDKGALFIPTNSFGQGSHSWSISVSDFAGNTSEAGATFSISLASDCPELSNLNVADGTTMPDVEAVWVQGRRDSNGTEQVTFDVNFSEPKAFNVRWDLFGHLVPLEFGTNVILITGQMNGKLYPEAMRVMRSDRFRARLAAPGSGDFVMSEPAMGYFANGQPQTASGSVSYKLDEGQPSEATLTSVTVNGIGCTTNAVDGNGNVGFATTNTVSVSTNFTSATVTACYGNGQCFTIPLGVWEGYYIQQRRVEIENRSLVLMFQRFPGNLCNGVYDWFVPNFPPIIRTDIRFSLATSGGMECTTNQLGNARTADSSHCADAPDFDALVYEYNVPPNASCEQRSQPTSRGLTFGYSKEHEFRSNDYNSDAVFDDELVSTVSFYWPSGETNEIVFTAPIYYGPDTPVIFTFEGVDYATTNALDLSQVTYDGNAPVTWSNEIGQVGYLLTVNGGAFYTNNRAKFSWPVGYTATSTTNTCQNCPPSYLGTASTYTISDKNWLTFSGFHNFRPEVRFFDPNLCSGWDPSEHPSWLIVPKGGVNTTLARYYNISPYLVNFRPVTIPYILNYPDWGENEPYDEIQVQGLQKGESAIRAGIGNSSLELARFRVSVKDQKVVTVSLHFVSDIAGHQTGVNPSQADSLITGMNSIFTPQANVVFQKLSVHSPVIQQDLGAEVDFPGNWNAVVSTGNPSADLNIFFVWSVNDNSPSGSGHAAGGYTFGPNCLLGDEIGNEVRAKGLAHEAGHFLGISPADYHTRQHELMYYSTEAGCTIRKKQADQVNP